MARTMRVCQWNNNSNYCFRVFFRWTE